MDTVSKRLVWSRRFTIAEAWRMYPEVASAMLAMIRVTMQRDAWSECGVHVLTEDIEIEETTFTVHTTPDEDDDPETFVSEPIEVTEFIARAYLTGEPTS